MSRKYHITTYLHKWILNDLPRHQQLMLEHHVSAQDYFGTLATILDLIHQQKYIDDVVFEEMVEELKHLQDHYVIARKK